ncbi:hypothetical protein T484DRAFT_1897645 [Baffinella frigidus]|nr:hypothetical protein T484DRAFT_1897645 [Cryptophyta sp. CCMP2293]
MAGEEWRCGKHGRVEWPHGGRKVALRKTMAQQGTLGAGVQVADHTYFAVRVRFPDQGGLETELVVDTAAGSSFITPAFAARVAAKPTGVTASVSTGTGGGGGLSQVTLGRMQFLAKDGGLVDAGRLDAIPIDLPTDPSISGLLGLDVLARFDVGISRGSLEASLHPPGSLQPPQGMREMPMSYLKPPAGLYSIQVRVAPVGGGGKESGTVTAIVDLGSPITIVNWRAMESAGIFPSSPLLRDTGEVVAGASVQGMGASSMRVFQIDLGLRAGGAKGEGVVKLGNHGVEVGDLPIFASLGMAGRPAMVLGSDVLLGGAGGGQMAISVSRSKLWVRLPDGV